MAKKILFIFFFLLSLNAFAEKHEEITPPAGPFVKDGVNVYLTGEFLWWKGIQEGLNYATSGVLVQPGTTLSNSGKVHKVHNPWKPGFRVGVGLYPGHDGWDLYARYTWYHSHSSDHASNHDGNMIPLGSYFGNLNSIEVNGVTSARSKWSLHYNVVDLELGRNFFLSKYLKTRLFSGLRATFNSQDWETHYYSNQITLGNDSPLPGSIRTKQDQDTWGIGIRMGANLTWSFYKALSLVSDISFAGVWIDYDNHRHDSISQTNGESRVNMKVKSDPNSTVFNIDLMLGFRGDWWLNNEAYHLSFQAGWENQLWLDYGNFIFFNRNGNGDLSFSGLTAKLRFDF